MSSGKEIERKFLVHKDMDWRAYAYSSSHIQQGYFTSLNTVRIRIRDNKGYLTIKGPSTNGGLTRYEFEKEITLSEANELMKLCEPNIIDKHRYLVEWEGKTYEIDVFHGDNEGLILAEIELTSETEKFSKPKFIGLEVTGDRRFYNSQMRRNPFKAWKDTLPKEYQ